MGVVKDNKKEDEHKVSPGNLVLEKEKISYSHVKTPDEVDDLPEHEVVVPDSQIMEEIKSEMSSDLEEKIALDESEKESDAYKKDEPHEKSAGSVEAVRDNEIVEVAVEQKHMQVSATTPVNEPKFKEEKQYITTDKDKYNKNIPDEKEDVPQIEKDDSSKNKKLTEEENEESELKTHASIEDIVIKPGLLKLIIFKAEELVNVDMIGKSDPYVKIKFRDQEYKSRKVRNTLQPEWNFSADLTISSSSENSDVIIEVYDDDFGKENFLGSYTFSLKEAIKETDKEAAWYNLVGCKSGKISFSTIYKEDSEVKTQSSIESKLMEEEESQKKKSGEKNKKEGLQLPEGNKEKKDKKEKELLPKTEIKDDADEKEKDTSAKEDKSESSSSESSESSKSSKKDQEKELIKSQSEDGKETLKTEQKESTEVKTITIEKKEIEISKISTKIIKDNYTSEKEKEDKDPEKKTKQ